MARTFSPFAEVDRLFADMTRTPASLAMPMDLYSDGDAFVAEIDLPGVDPSTIDVDVEDHTLTVRAERRPSASEGERSWLTRERPVGTFARQLTLGRRVAVDGIHADYSDGVLRLRFPLADEAKPRKIAVAHTSRTLESTAGGDSASSDRRASDGDHTDTDGAPADQH
ncbi:Hsp20/alpha crystallin family protein [Brachybacterium sp. EF45031]|uniref:Hsp20/alpha crystallin family protein n=1 Tax=Brachybacterium sillae TaxID=2810536 RepID=UPI00217EC836|nr:Hsp20/alpha crystallin family protein [Brachybacterium sillae]MCS6711777.1 Hsp20/alpha crystallin family protein [Brachybacterium sillae]